MELAICPWRASTLIPVSPIETPSRSSVMLPQATHQQQPLYWSTAVCAKHSRKANLYLMLVESDVYGWRPGLLP